MPKPRLSQTLVGCGAFALALTLPAASALAGGPDGHARNKECRADVEALCADAETRSDVRACLLEHQAELSAPCAQKLHAMQERAEAVRTACAEDLNAFCADADRPRKARRCLHDHSEELSQACATALAAARPHGRHRGMYQ